MKKIILLITLSLTGLQAHAGWTQALSCDNGALIVDNRPRLRQLVITDNNVINYFHSLGMFDPTPNQAGGYYDGIPVKSFTEFQGKMIFESYVVGNSDFSVKFNANTINQATSYPDYLFVEGENEGQGYKITVSIKSEYRCFQDVDGYQVCYGGMEKVGDWYFQHCS